MLCVTPSWAGEWRFRRFEGFCGRLPVAAWFLLWVAVLFELCWRAQWASIPAGLRARGSRRRRVTVAGVNTAAAHGLCGNRELASARRYGHPLRQRADGLGSGQSGLPDLRTNLVRKPVGWLWRQAEANSRLPQSWLTIEVLTPAEVACQYLEPRARRPGATDARRASPGGRVRPAALQTSKKYTENQPLALAVYRVIAIKFVANQNDSSARPVTDSAPSRMASRIPGARVSKWSA